MKAVRVHAPGGPEALQWEDAPEPVPRAGDAVVRLEAIGVNFIDVYFRTGQYPAPFPFTLGQEGAGQVTALGPGATGVQVGDRVAFTGLRGAYAEAIAAPADRLVKLPPGITAKQGAAAMLQGMTAHYLATSTVPLRRGDTCLVHAAAGGVGLLLCQIARRRGATVIGTASSEPKAQLARAAGASEVIDYTQKDFVAEVKRITHGRGVHAVFDSVGQATFLKGLDCLAPRGVMALFGQSSGPVAPFDPQLLNQKGSLFLTRPSLPHYIQSRDDLVSRASEVLEWVARGELQLRVFQELPLAHAAEAHRLLESRATTGKLLLIP